MTTSEADLDPGMVRNNVIEVAFMAMKIEMLQGASPRVVRNQLTQRAVPVSDDIRWVFESD